MVFRDVLSMVASQKELKKTWFLDWFFGNAIKSYWTSVNNGAGGTSAMVQNAHNEGFEITTLAGLNDGLNFTFNDIRHYSQTGAVCIGIMRAVEGTDGLCFIGFHNESATFDRFAEVGKDAPANANFVIETQDGGALTTVASSIPHDTIFHRHKIELLSASAKYTLDGILEATATLTLPTVRLQPVFRGVNRVASVRNFRYRYLEVFAT